jgi:hypothetical protein
MSFAHTRSTAAADGEDGREPQTHPEDSHLRPLTAGRPLTSQPVVRCRGKSKVTVETPSGTTPPSTDPRLVPEETNTPRRLISAASARHNHLHCRSDKTEQEHTFAEGSAVDASLGTQLPHNDAP